VQTLQHIPVWVFALFIGLVALGLRQTRTRQIARKRLLRVNVALTVVTLVGVVQLWRHTPWLSMALVAWATSCLLASWLLGQGAAPAGAHYNPDTRRLNVPGSWLPLALFMALFACKFAVGMLTATSPETLRSLQAAIGISALYGLLSGILNARSWRLLKLKPIV
jgi:hypothetical protein